MNKPNAYVTKERIRLMRLALEGGFDSIPPPNLVERLIGDFGFEDAHWGLRWMGTQDLRKRKFVLGERMAGSREAFEQATHEAVAAYRASCFPAGALVADLTCSIGGDLIALAKRGPAIGLDRDAERLGAAEWNLSLYGLSAELVREDCFEVEWNFELAIADPARRVEARRTLDPADFAPNPILLAERMRGLRLGCLKLSPMLNDDWLESLEGRLEFLSFGRSCCEASVWLGSDSAAGRYAVQVESGETLCAGDSGPRAESCDSFLFTCDLAAIRAHCLGELCRAHGLREFVDSNGYLTGPKILESPWLTAFRVLYEGPGRPEKTKQALRDLGAATPVVLSRLAKVDVEALRKLWRMSGAREVYVAIAPDGKRPRHLILESP